MDDTPPNQTPGENFNKIDLTALEAFQFGTQWTDAGGAKKSAGAGEGDHSRGHGGDAGPARRDRRPPRRSNEGSGASGDAPRGPSNFSGGGPREGGGGARPGGGREGGHRFEQRQRFERGGQGFERGPGGGGQRFERGGEQRFERGGDPRDRGPRRPMGPPRPYVSPIFEVTFYPDDTGFNALVKAMRASCRTYELFEIARLILGKVERCVVVFRRRTETPGTAAGLLYISVPDGIPFETEDQAIGHALEHSLDQFFSTETVEVEPPKGSFQFVNRCPVTKDLLGPPNYHRYGQIVQHHYTARGINMPFERYKASIEVVRDPEAIAAWLESMKKITRYTYRGTAEGETTVFDNLEDARAFLLRACRDRLVRAAETARLTAKAVETVPQSEAAEAMHGTLEAQRRFPLDTANALRGRLRRENFHIFKRGSKGVTYVCSVRRKFRQTGQTFSESINRLIEFLEKNPMIPVSELAPKLLGFSPPAAPTAAAPAPAATAPATTTEGAASEPAPPAAAAPAPESMLTPEQTSALNRLILDLRWLVSEGYVAEYSDGKLFVQPVLAQGQAEPDEKDHDPAATKAEAPPPLSAEASAREIAAEPPPAPEIPPVANSGPEAPPASVAAVEPSSESSSEISAENSSAETRPADESSAPPVESAPRTQG